MILDNAIFKNHEKINLTFVGYVQINFLTILKNNNLFFL